MKKSFMTSHEAQQTLLQPHEEEQEEESEFRSKKQFTSLQSVNDHVKSSFEILKSSVRTITSNYKFMFLMILSTLPFFVFMVFFEIVIIPKIKDALAKFLIPPSLSHTYDYFNGDEFDHDQNDPTRKNCRIILEFFPVYLVFLPMLELFGLPIIINVAAETYAGVVHSSSTLKQEISEVFYHKNYFRGAFITSIWVQLLSICTLAGLFWTVISHHYIMYLFLGCNNVEMLSLVLHGVIFFGVIYKYLEWCAIWNMGMAISVLQKERGAYALEMAACYGKHCRRTGFELMLIFFTYNVGLRMPFLVARVFSYMSVGVYGVVVIVFVVGLICLGSLVKWVTIVLYFYDCKVQVLSKKVDEEVEK